MIRITAGGLVFSARFETSLAPRTVAAVSARLPLKSLAVHVRWSGEAVWLPLGNIDFGVGYENATSFPAPGQVILHPGSLSETEILIAYGGVSFASKVGQLAGNHFLTITDGIDQLPELGRRALWHGAQEVVFEVK